MTDARRERDKTLRVSDGDTTRQPNTGTRLGHFKYYIHDSVEECRLQLIGDLSSKEVPELNGCWRTVKTTLGERKLSLDLRGLRSLDEAGKVWIVGRAAEGAVCSPETFLRDRLAGERIPGKRHANAKNGLFARLMSALRGAPVPGTE